ncbi:MAG: hypothetical protein GY696_20955 [Gammaproteobacteria bacterium]|nr:hypothetical protein [Gammaproteobacteria bacterium]
MLNDNHPDKQQSGLKILEEKQSLLVELVSTARAIERMQQGLHSVLILGQSSDDIPDDVLEIARQLGASIQSQSNETIHAYLDRLEHVIQSNIQQIISYADIDLESISQIGPISPYSEQAISLLQEFQRHAKTAVSLKVLMHDRGIKSPGISISLPLSEIKTRLDTLRDKEIHQRSKIKQQIIETKKELEQVQREHHFSEEMHNTIADVIDGLDQDLSAIESGISIDDLPMSFEQLDSNDTHQSMDEQPAQTIQPDPENEKSVTAANTTENTDSSGHVANRLRKWLNTPWSTSWKQIRQMGEKEK